jgi:hypothetical protein
VNRVPTISALALLLSGCSLAANRDVQAYNACLSRHAQDVVVCEGPRQAYEADLSAHRANAAVTQPGPVHGTPEPALQSSAQGLLANKYTAAMNASAPSSWGMSRGYSTSECHSPDLL